MRCIVCETLCDAEFCHDCLGCGGDPIEPDHLGPPPPPPVVPDKQLPGRIVDLRETMGVVNNLFEYVKRTHLGEETPFPYREVGARFVVQQSPLQKVPFKNDLRAVWERNKLCTYGAVLDGLDTVEDVEDIRTLLLFDPKVDDWDEQWTALRKRKTATYVLLLDVEKALYGRPSRLPELFLAEPETARTFIADSWAHPELIIYQVSDLSRLLRELWSRGMNLTCHCFSNKQTAALFSDFKVYKLVHGDPLPKDFSIAAEPTFQNMVRSQHVSVAVQKRSNEVVVDIGGSPAFVTSEIVEETPLFIDNIMTLNSGVRETAPVIPPGFMNLSNEDKEVVGRVVVNSRYNYASLDRSLYPRLMSVGTGPPVPVKYWPPGAKDVSLYEPNPMGPLLVKGNLFSESTDYVIRCAVAFNHFRDAAVTPRGVISEILYSELDGAPYLHTGRTLAHTTGIIIKLLEIPTPEFEAELYGVYPKAPHCKYDVKRIAAVEEGLMEIKSTYIEIFTDNPTLDVFEDFFTRELLVQPMQVHFPLFCADRPPDTPIVHPD